MKRSWLVLVVISALGLLAGVAIAGRPTKVDDTVITPVPATVPATTVSTTPPTAAPSTTAGERLDAGAVRVVVANATNQAGIAGTTADALVDAGFTATRAVDAIDARAVTAIFARDGFEEAAALVAQELGLSASVVQPLPEAAVTADDAGADVIVAIGDDFPA